MAEAPDRALVGWYELLTRAELAVGIPSAAARWADAAAAAARNADLSGRSGLALLTQAQAATSTDPEAAHALAIAARDALGSAGMSFNAARATLAAAEAMAACGDLDQAGADARAARAAFRSRGAGPLARSAASLRRRVSASYPRNRLGGASASSRPGTLSRSPTASGKSPPWSAMAWQRRRARQARPQGMPEVRLESQCPEAQP